MSAPRLSARMKALNEAAVIAEGRARLRRYLAEIAGNDDGGGDDDHVAANEADHIARLIRERMQDRRAKP